MKIFVTQIYIEGNTSYRFSHLFQRRMLKKLTDLTEPSAKFISEYGENFQLIFRMSAKSHLKKNEVRGPTVFRKDKDVEYTIFLPFDHSTPLDETKRRFALENLFLGIFEVLNKYEIKTSNLEDEKERIISEILSNPMMNEGKRWDED